MIKRVLLGLLATFVLAAGWVGYEVYTVYTLLRRPPPAKTPAVAAKATARTIAQGRIVGHETELGAHAWPGIPFAAAPVGNLRWKAPRPPTSWEGERTLLEPPPRCPQPVGRGEGFASRGQEDCL